MDEPHSEGPKRWRLAVQQCNDKDATLPYVDSEFKLDALKDLMIKKQISKQAHFTHAYVMMPFLLPSFTDVHIYYLK